MVSTLSYGYEDFIRIKAAAVENHILYELPPNVIDVFKFLNTEFSNIISLNKIEANHQSQNQNQHHQSGETNEFKRVHNKQHFRRPIDKNWEREKASAEFIATVQIKKEGIELKINEIRICLNKITNKNYETHKENIVKIINDIVADNENIGDNCNTDLNKIATILFDIASTNKFYSEIYAILLKELIQLYPIFEEIVATFFKTSYLESVNAIVFVDQNKDFDAFCLNNKANDKRKAMAVFITNLVKQEIVLKEDMIQLIQTLQTMIMTYVDEPDQLFKVEEITENIFLIIPALITSLKSVAGWDKICENIRVCSQYKVKEHCSLSSRTLFKYKDIMDILNKTK